MPVMEIIRTNFCSSCGVCFNEKIAQSNSLYDHSRPELCFICQRSVPFFIQEPDNPFYPWRPREYRALLPGETE